MERIVKSQPARKKLWWLILLGPLLYVAVDNLIFPIDERALLSRTEYVEEARELPSPPESADEEAAAADDTYPDGHSHDGWEIYDMIWVRIDKAWPMVLSLLAFVFRKKLVGDPK